MALVPRSQAPADGPVFERIPGLAADVEGLKVQRLMPRRQRRTIGPWCFIDHFGPAEFSMSVGGHPHIGLQTVTWLFEGEAVHRDSLGTEQSIRPGQLNWMTSGVGISHSEMSPDPDTTPRRGHGIQLWVALDDASRNVAPHFEHHPALPRHDETGWACTVLAGEAFGLKSPARAYSPIVGLEISFATHSSAHVPLDPEFEHALFVPMGAASVVEEEVDGSELIHLGRGREALELTGTPGARIIVLGGAPMTEPLLMWWNFVARSEEEIRAAREDWVQRSERFGTVPGARIEAPPLPPRP